MTERVVAPAVSAPRQAVPDGACDTHTHVFDARFPGGPSPYALPLASLDVHRAMRATLGCRRAVLVQPAPYGRDPACLLDALARGGGTLRGVMIADETVSDATLEAWHAAGIRALRFVEMRAPGGTGRYPGAIGIETLEALAPRLRALGWQAHLWASAAQCAEILPRVAALRVPLVIDHLGCPQGAADPAFDTLLGHFRDGNAWIKATLCRVPRGGSGYDVLRPLQDRLVAANPASRAVGLRLAIRPHGAGAGCGRDARPVPGLAGRRDAGAADPGGQPGTALRLRRPEEREESDMIGRRTALALMAAPALARQAAAQAFPDQPIRHDRALRRRRAGGHHRAHRLGRGMDGRSAEGRSWWKRAPARAARSAWTPRRRRGRTAIRW